MRRLAVVFPLLLLSAPAFADFEGVIEMKMTMGEGQGKARFFVSRHGFRNEMETPTPAGPMKMSMLVKAGAPDVVYNINDEDKTYAEMNLKGARGASGRAAEALTLKDLGKETVQGYSCRHVLLTGKRTGEMELWTTREIMGYGDFAGIMGPRASGDDSLQKKLREAGADGFPVKSVHRSGRETVTMEVVKVEKKALPASRFQVPAGYAKSEGFGGMPGAPAGGMPPDAKKQMEDAMKDLSPEQREMMKKMMGR